MPRVEIKHGMFSWIDLMSSDTAASKSFYGETFGWTSEDYPTDQGSPYTMFRITDT